MFAGNQGGEALGPTDGWRPSYLISDAISGNLSRARNQGVDRSQSEQFSLFAGIYAGCYPVTAPLSWVAFF